MFRGIPIIGIAGGIGSGKSFVARCFAELGCCVIDSDAQVRAAYEDPEIRASVRRRWGDDVFAAGGAVNRAALAKRVFADAEQRKALENLIHPWVDAQRQRQMEAAVSGNSLPVAFVWDTPLLFEAGLAKMCDAVVFVDTPEALRLHRVQQSRGWDALELGRREKLQWPLDNKREVSDYVLNNAADAALTRDQVRELLSQILAQIA